MVSIHKVPVVLLLIIRVICSIFRFKIGNLYLVHLLKQGKGLKRFLHNYAINL